MNTHTHTHTRTHAMEPRVPSMIGKYSTGEVYPSPTTPFNRRQESLVCSEPRCLVAFTSAVPSYSAFRSHCLPPPRPLEAPAENWNHQLFLQAREAHSAELRADRPPPLGGNDPAQGLSYLTVKLIQLNKCTPTHQLTGRGPGRKMRL